MRDEIKIKPRRNRGTHEVIYWKTQNGRRTRVRETFKIKKAAETRRDELVDERKIAGESFSRLTPAERADLILVSQEIRTAGYSLRAVWDGFMGGLNTTTPKNVVTLKTAFETFIAEMKDRGQSELYIESLEGYIDQFIRGREMVAISKITTDLVQAWFTGRNEAKTTRQSNLGRLASYFDHAWRKHYITENPCDRIKRPRIDGEPPKILTPIGYARMLIGTLRKHPKALAWVVCGQIAGLRPQETVYKVKKTDTDEQVEKKIAKKVGWKDVDLDKGRIRVDKAASKVNQRRIVHLEPSAIEWLKLAKDVGAELPVNFNNKKRYIKELRKLINLKKWPQDLLRHTAATVLMSKYQDAGKVADELGNSASVLLNSYKELMYKEVAGKLLAIVPSRLKKVRAHATAKKKISRNSAPSAGKIIHLPSHMAAVAGAH